MFEDNKYYEFIAKDLAGELTIAQQEKLYSFLNRNQENRIEYEKLKSLYLKSNYSKTSTELNQKFTDLLATINQLDENKQQHDYKVRYLWMKIAIAAAFIGCIFLLFIPRNNLSDNKIVITEDRSIKKIELPDKTIISLNAHSSLKWDSVSYNKKNRTVYLEGEAYFDVSKNKKLPFIVKTKYSQIKVLGTAFNVKSFTDQRKNANFETELLRGKIELSFNNRKEKLYLLPNEKVRVDNIVGLVNNENVRVSKFQIAPNQIRKDTAWIQDEFIWDNTPLSTIVTEIENRFNVSITIEDEELKGYRYSGNISSESLEKLLSSLSLIRPFKYNISNKDITIKK